MASTINASTTLGLISTADTSGVLQLQTANTAALTIDASQNVGIGTASPDQPLVVNKASGSNYLKISGTNNTAWDIGLQFTDGTNTSYIGQLRGSLSGTAGALAFVTGGAIRTVIDSAGNFGLGTTSPSSFGRFAVVGGGAFTNNGALRFYNSNNTNWGFIDNPATDGSAPLRFATGAGEVARFSNTGNFGIGNSSPENPLDVQRDSTTSYSATTDQRSQAKIIARNASESAGYFSSMSLVTGGGNQAEWSLNNVYSSAYSGSLTFKYRTGGSSWAEAARFDTSGNLTVGGTTSYGTITGVKATGNQLATNATQSGNGVTSGIALCNQGTVRASIYQLSTDNALYVVADSNGVKLNPTATSWTSASDERLKDIIEPITDAITKVSTLRAVIGKYKTDAEGTRRSFLIAQDIQAVLPEAVDASNPDNLGVQYTEVIPLLVAAIKEQTTLIESLKARLDAANL